MIQAVIFDLDGTLLDTIEDIAAPVNAALGRRGFPTHESADYRFMVGNGFENLIRQAIPEAQVTEALVQELRGEAETAYAAAPVVKTRPYPGVIELLAALGARGIPRAVLSNKPDALVQSTCAILLSSGGFAMIRGETPEFARKPEPAAALDIARRLGAEPSRILYLGDSDVDMRTARNAGMIGVGAAWGFRGAEELLAAGALHLLEAPLELLGLLDRLG